MLNLGGSEMTKDQDRERIERCLAVVDAYEA